MRESDRYCTLCIHILVYMMGSTLDGFVVVAGWKVGCGKLTGEIDFGWKKNEFVN